MTHFESGHRFALSALLTNGYIGKWWFTTIISRLVAQPAGMPEMCKKSMTECSANGGEELFIIGKNFTRGTKVKFQQMDPNGTTVWSAEAPIDQEYFHQVWYSRKIIKNSWI